jgi:restriction system protein
MKNYWLIRLGRKNVYAKDGHDGGYIGVGFLENINLSDKLFENWRDFNREMIPVYLKDRPEKSRVAAGLACGNLWTVIKGMLLGDVVLCPLGNNTYAVGEIIGNYSFQSGAKLPHRRAVKWFTVLSKDLMSDGLKNTAGAIMTAFSLNRYQEELGKLIGTSQPFLAPDGVAIEDASVFALEKHLEDFLVLNWKRSDLAKKYDIYEADGEIIGQQYPSDTGPIDILAISKNKKELLVVELKKGRASDVVVGQIQRYMGFVKDELAEKGQVVKGLIISFEDDVRLRRALSVTSNIDLMFYEVTFKLKSSK